VTWSDLLQNCVTGKGLAHVSPLQARGVNQTANLYETARHHRTKVRAKVFSTRIWLACMA